MTTSETAMIAGLPVFSQNELLTQALTHKSYRNENQKSVQGDNERLEFLGDAVLDLVLSHHLYELHPEMPEGDLSKIRASLVNETTLTEIALSLRLNEHLRLGRGESQSGGATKPRLLSSALEAVVGALYLDQGYEATKTFVLEQFAPKMAELDKTVHFREDYKTRLQEKLQELHRRTPQYEVIREEGPDHDKTFTVRLTLDGKELSVGTGKSKKQAEQNAARVALEGMK